MAKLKMNRHVPNKNAVLLKKNQLNGNRAIQHFIEFQLKENEQKLKSVRENTTR